MRAFLISLMGLFLGPGLVYIHDEPELTQTLGILNILILIVFYLTLYFGDKLQKKYFTNNKFANKIRFLLAWPCLRTKGGLHRYLEKVRPLFPASSKAM